MMYLLKIIHFFLAEHKVFMQKKTRRLYKPSGSRQPNIPRPYLVEIHLSHFVCLDSLDQLLEDLENVKGCSLVNLVVGEFPGVPNPAPATRHLETQPVHNLPLGAYPCRHPFFDARFPYSYFHVFISLGRSNNPVPLLCTLASLSFILPS